MLINSKLVLYSRIVLFLSSLIISFPCDICEGGAVSPRNGGALPPGIMKIIRGGRQGSIAEHGWLNKGLVGRVKLGKVSDVKYGGTRREVTGTLMVPVAPVLYNDVEFPPIELSLLYRELFGGPWPDGTMSEYFNEVSRGKLDVSGTVFEWSHLTHDEIYYTGNIVDPPKMGELISETLVQLDPHVDFGSFDNDGPDDIPNSGDDDGYVDVLVLVHPSEGAECGNNIIGMWSHSSSYSLWSSDSLPYSTNDPSSSGGSIMVDNYMICPALSCSGDGAVMIEIGVFCHELCHTLGLPDLYDYNGGGTGIGHWGLMGAGNWNMPSSPAHPCAWSKEQLGWVEPVVVGWCPVEMELMSSNMEGVVVKLDHTTRRFRRLDISGMGNDYALVCGYTSSETGGRNWPGGAGYGNMWEESLFHSFHFEGDGDLLIEYRMACDLEENYDFGYLLLETGYSIDTLAEYTGRFSKNEHFIISGLSSGAPLDYELRFLFVSDYSFSDSDGGYDSEPGMAFMIDDLSISGGGIEWFSDFENDAGGWMDDSEAVEYFLVENRQRSGFDSHLHGEGLLIWHVESSIAYSYLGNSGGYSNQTARGVVLEESDGQFELINSYFPDLNYGDVTDPFSLLSGNNSFTSSTVPSSRDNSGNSTSISVTGIREYFCSVSAIFRGDALTPVVESVNPDTVERVGVELDTLDVWGEGFLPGASCTLLSHGHSVECTRTVWMGHTHLVAVVSTKLLLGGSWDVEVIADDGQRSVCPDGLFVRSSFISADVKGVGDHVLISWELSSAERVKGFLLYRAASDDPYRIITPDTLRTCGTIYNYKDFHVMPSLGYSYMIVALLDDGEREELELEGRYSISEPPLVYPNPFNGTVTISFYVPERLRVSVMIYDVAGRRVKNFGEKIYTRGMSRLSWTPESDVSSGVYFCRIRTGWIEDTVKIVYIR